MQLRQVIKSPLFNLKLARNFTCQQSAAQKVVSENPGSKSYWATHKSALNCQWVSIQRSETNFQELCDLQGLTFKLGHWHSKREIKTFWNKAPTCLSNAKHNKKTVSLLRHICTCHLKLEDSGEILCFSNFLFGLTVSWLMSSSKIPLKQKKEAFFKFHSRNESSSCSFGSIKCGMTVFGTLPAS